MRKRKVRCTVELSLDEKGRLRLPTRVRNRLEADEDEILVASSRGNNLRLYREEFFEENVAARAEAVDPLDPEGEEFYHRWLAGVEDLAWDRQGRIQIPAWMRGELGLDGEDPDQRRCTFIWYGDWGELWRSDRWAERRRELHQQRQQEGSRRGA